VILALETASTACSAALLDEAGAVVAESLSIEGPAHSQRLLPGVHEVLTAAGVGLAAVDTVVASLGPGAFTGLRIGVATARALAQATGVRLVGVPTLAALALALAEGEAGASASSFVPLIDGRRGEVFAAVYDREDDEELGLRLQEVVPLVVLKLDDLARFLSRFGGAAVGGDGAVVAADRLPPAVVLDRAVAAPTATMVGRAWVHGAPGTVGGFADVLPIYGRRPDAVPSRVRGAM
jgi:tRNA threonylcarbamoyladenosine biosynthesis protein TsaB